MQTALANLLLVNETLVTTPTAEEIPPPPEEEDDGGSSSRPGGRARRSKQRSAPAQGASAQTGAAVALTLPFRVEGGVVRRSRRAGEGSEVVGSLVSSQVRLKDSEDADATAGFLSRSARPAPPTRRGLVQSAQVFVRGCRSSDALTRELRASGMPGVIVESLSAAVRPRPRRRPRRRAPRASDGAGFVRRWKARRRSPCRLRCPSRRARSARSRCSPPPPPLVLSGHAASLTPY